MPWKIQRKGSQYCVLKETGETVHCHPSKAKAQAHMRALYASENKSKDPIDVIKAMFGLDGQRRI